MADDFEHDPRNLVKVIFDGAKLWWIAGLASKIVAAVLGIVAVLLNLTSAAFPIALAALAIASEFFQWRSDALKGRAEGLKRKIEYQDAFGWQISRIDYSDHLANLSGKQRNAVAQSVKENYFASRQPKGPVRAMENLQESSWWSKHLAGTMEVVCGVTIAFLLLGSIFGFNLSISTIKDFTTLQSVSRVVTSVLALIASLGLIRLLSGYYAFARRSELIEQAVAVLLKDANVDQVSALRQLHEYQIARASAPLIPDVVWKTRRATLNNLWNAYRQGHSE